MKSSSSRYSRPTTAKKGQKNVLPILESSDLNDLLQFFHKTRQQLIIKQKQCERSGKYVEAENFKRKIKGLKQQAQKNDYLEIKERHQLQKRQIEEAHLEQLNCFNIEWDQKISSLNQQIMIMENDLVAKHEIQIKKIQEEILQEKPTKFKESGQLLNLRKIEQELAKQQNYMEARQVQVKTQKLEKEELQRWKNNQTSKCKNSLNVLKQKHQAQLKVLHQRIELSIEEKHRQRMQEQEKLMLKYQNVLKELQYQQKQQLVKFQKSNKLKGIQKKTKTGTFSISKIVL